MSNLYLQCGRCGARWALCELPVDVDRLVKLNESAAGRCPHCPKKTDTYMCATEGRHAVREARGPVKAIKTNGGKK